MRANNGYPLVVTKNQSVGKTRVGVVNWPKVDVQGATDWKPTRLSALEYAEHALSHFLAIRFVQKTIICAVRWLERLRMIYLFFLRTLTKVIVFSIKFYY